MPAIEVRGLREVSNAFRKVDREIPKGLRGAFLPIAQRVTAAIRVAVSTDAKNPTGRAAASVRPRASQRGAGVAFGGDAAPYFPWLDFGGRVGRRGLVVRPYLGYPLGDGRYVYPAIEDQREQIGSAAEDAVLSAARAAGFEVN
jgi:hypothetical protein